MRERFQCEINFYQKDWHTTHKKDQVFARGLAPWHLYKAARHRLKHVSVCSSLWDVAPFPFRSPAVLHPNHLLQAIMFWGANLSRQRVPSFHVSWRASKLVRKAWKLSKNGASECEKRLQQCHHHLRSDGSRSAWPKASRWFYHLSPEMKWLSSWKS